jgi:hypothetical protein
LVAGFDAATRELFQAACASLYDSTCTIKGIGVTTPDGRFGRTETLVELATEVPCSVQHYTPGRSLYADKLGGRVIAMVYMPRAYTVLKGNLILVDGGDTYEVVGPPHLDGPDDPALEIPVGAYSPPAVNP